MHSAQVQSSEPTRPAVIDRTALSQAMGDVQGQGVTNASGEDGRLAATGHLDTPSDIQDFKSLLRLLGPPFAQECSFWKLAAVALLLGGLSGLIALGFFNLFTIIAEHTWETESYRNNTSHGDLDVPGHGHWIWLITTTLGGLAVGLIKLFWHVCVSPFPDNPPGLVTEVSDLKVHEPALAVPLLLCSVVSLGCGASVGPEAANGAAGVALGALAAKLHSSMRPHAEMLVYIGIAAAFGPLLPSPALAVLILHELSIAGGEKPKFGFMRSVTLSAVAASSAYCVFTAVEPFTLLDKTVLPLALYEFPNVKSPSIKYMVYAIPLGIASALMGLCGVASIGIGKALGGTVRELINRVGRRCCGSSRGLGLMLTPVVGGLLIGLIAVAEPLTLGDGSAQLGIIIKQALLPTVGHGKPNLGVGSLMSTAFLKILALGTSLGFGFVGGQIFPLIFSGTCLGAAASVWLDNDLPVPIAVACGLVAVPCGFTPIIFTLLATASGMLVLGASATAPVFVAAVVAHVSLCGIGIMQRLIGLALRRALLRWHPMPSNGPMEEQLLGHDVQGEVKKNGSA